MGLFTPLHKSKDLDERKKWIIKKFNPQNPKHIQILSEIAKNDKNRYVRQEAVERLTDQIVLAEIAKNDEDYCIQLQAYGKLGLRNSIEALFLKIENESDGGRMDMIKNLEDQNILAGLAKISNNYRWGPKIVKKISDQNALADIVKIGKDESTRMAALEKITDQNFLADIAKNAKENSFRLVATEKLTDQNILAAIAINDKEESVRKSAVNKLTDQNALSDIAENDMDIELQLAASLKLADITLKTNNLIRLFSTDNSDKIVIAIELRNIYNKKLLSPGDEAKILQLRGQLIKGHSDYNRQHSDNFSCKKGDYDDYSHVDYKEERFNI